MLVTLALNHANEFDTFGPSPNIAGTEAKTVQDLNEYYRGWRYLVGRIASKYDLWSATAQLSTEQNSRLDLLSFPTGKEVMPIMQNPQFDIHDGDFSFSTDVLLESLPAAGAEWVVATDPGSWRLSLVPAATEGFIEVRLMMVSTKSIWFEDLYTPGDVLTLSHEVACSGQCSIDIAFTVLNLPYYESSVILYVDDENVDSHYAAPRHYGGPGNLVMYQVYADENTQLLLGNDESGQQGLVGKLRAPSFYQIALTPKEIAGVFDGDGDGIPDGADNCPAESNPSQSFCADSVCH